MPAQRAPSKPLRAPESPGEITRRVGAKGSAHREALAKMMEHKYGKKMGDSIRNFEPPEPDPKIKTSIVRRASSVGKGLLRGAAEATVGTEAVSRITEGAAREKFKREAREQDKPTKSGLKRPKTKA